MQVRLYVIIFLYQLGYLNATRFPNLLFGFIHVPYIPEQVESTSQSPSLSLDTIVKGLIAAIEAIDRNDDIKIPLGERH